MDSDSSVDAEVCFICLAGHDERHEPIVSPCACPSMLVHRSCLARWQLQQAGKDEERTCRFCHSLLPSWRDALADLTGTVPDRGSDTADGTGGVEAFKDDVRRLLGLAPTQAFDITFECMVPSSCTGEESRVELQGLRAFDAAVYCAALSASRRLGRSGAEEGEHHRSVNGTAFNGGAEDTAGNSSGSEGGGGSSRSSSSNQLSIRQMRSACRSRNSAALRQPAERALTRQTDTAQSGLVAKLFGELRMLWHYLQQH